MGLVKGSSRPVKVTMGCGEYRRTSCDFPFYFLFFLAFLFWLFFFWLFFFSFLFSHPVNITTSSTIFATSPTFHDNTKFHHLIITTFVKNSTI